MDFETHLREGKIREVKKDIIRAKSLMKSSEQAIDTSKLIPLNKDTCKTIFRELYEGLREYCEALGYLHGYKFFDHMSITYFLKEVINKNEIAKKFDRLRKIRNGINYYGEDLNLETVEETLKEIPSIIKELKKI